MMYCQKHFFWYNHTSRKKSDTLLCEEFRPINKVPPYKKILELCVYDQIMNYIETNKMLNEHQAGFRSQNSWEVALQAILLNWMEVFEESEMVKVVFLDFKRAFGTIDICSWTNTVLE